jgi:ADP-ribosylglycohydrolase/protein-tyrosine phosphatase
MITTASRFRGALLGLAVGDALGTTLEFKRPGSFSPIDDIVGGGPFDLEPGQWTDDTSMALCLAESLVDTGELDLADQLRRYVRWYRHGYLSSTGQFFDIGTTTREALERFERDGDEYAGSEDPRQAGNGSIMRLAPVPLLYSGASIQRAGKQAGISSMTTHRAEQAVDACRFLGELVAGASRGLPKDRLLAPSFFHDGPLAPEIQTIVEGSYRRKEPPAIRGTGYVVESLEAALWAFQRSSDFREGAVLAVNLGDDADTTGAVYGQLAGAYYGEEGIPDEWRAKLALRETIESLADRVFRASRRTPMEESFWIEEGQLLAGKYVGSKSNPEAAAKVNALAATGVTLIVDLTHESDRLAPYAAHVAAPMQHVSLPIRDFHAPTLAELIPMLNRIDDEIAAGGVVYVHCWGGCGRTGAVVASWLVKQGWSAESALDRYAELSRDVCGRRCPEQPSQFELVETYAATVAANA